MAKQEEQSPNLIPKDEDRNKDETTENLANLYEGDLEAVKSGLEKEAELTSEGLNEAVESETEQSIKAGKDKLDDVKSIEGAFDEDVDDVEAIIASSEMESRRLREEIAEKERELDQKKKQLKDIESAVTEPEKEFSEDELMDTEGKAREEMLAGKKIASETGLDDTSPDDGSSPDVPPEGPDTPGGDESEPDATPPDGGDSPETPPDDPDTPGGDEGVSDDTTPDSDGKTEVTEGDAEGVGELPERVASGFNEFNVNLDALKDLDAETYEKLEGLSEGQQLMVLKNLKQLTLGRVRDEANDKFSSDISKLDKSDPKANFLARIAQKIVNPISTGKMIYKGFTKQIQVAQNEKDIAKAYKDGGVEVHQDTLKQLVDGMDAYGPDVEIKDGQLEVQYARSDESYSDSEKIMVNGFNDAATKLSQIPDEWGYKTASGKQKKQFEEAEKNFLAHKSKLLDIMENKNEADPSIEDAGRSAMEGMAEMEGNVRMNRFLNVHPEVEDALQKIDDQKAWQRVWKTALAEKGAYMIAGGVTRSITVGLAGALAAPLAAAGFGAAAARLRSKAELGEQEGRARRGKEDHTLDHKLNLSGYRGSAGMNADKSREKYKDYVEAEYLNESLEFMVKELRNPENVTDPNARKELAMSLMHELKEAEDKMIAGEINYGKQDNWEDPEGNFHKGRIANQYELNKIIAESKVFLEYELNEGTISNVDMASVYKEYDTKHKNPNSRKFGEGVKGIDQFLEEQEGNRTDAEKKFIRQQMKRGAIMGATFASIGMIGRDALGAGYDAGFGSDEAPAGSGAARPDTSVPDKLAAAHGKDVPDTPPPADNTSTGVDTGAEKIIPAVDDTDKTATGVDHETDPWQGKEVTSDGQIAHEAPEADTDTEPSGDDHDMGVNNLGESDSGLEQPGEPGTIGENTKLEINNIVAGMSYDDFDKLCQTNGWDLKPEYNEALGQNEHIITNATGEKLAAFKTGEGIVRYNDGVSSPGEILKILPEDNTPEINELTQNIIDETNDMNYREFQQYCREHDLNLKYEGDKVHNIIDPETGKTIGTYNSGTKEASMLETVDAEATGVEGYQTHPDHDGVIDERDTMQMDESKLTHPDHDGVTDERDTMQTDVPEDVNAQGAATEGVTKEVEAGVGIGAVAEGVTESAAETSGTPEAPAFKEHLDYQGGKHVWGEASKQLQGRFEEVFNKLGGGNSEAEEALKTYNIDRLKDTVADAIKNKDVNLIDKYGLKGIADIDNVSKEELAGMKWDEIFEDTFEAKSLTDGLSEDQIKNIVESNAKLSDYFKNNPDVPRTSENYDSVLRGEDPGAVVEPKLVADSGDEKLSAGLGEAENVAAGPSNEDKLLDAMANRNLNSKVEHIYDRLGPGGQIEEWTKHMKDWSAAKALEGDFGEAQGSGLDQAEINNRNQLLEYLKEAQAEIGDPGDKSVSEYLLEYEKSLGAKEVGLELSTASEADVTDAVETSLDAASTKASVVTTEQIIPEKTTESLTPQEKMLDSMARDSLKNNITQVYDHFGPGNQIEEWTEHMKNWPANKILEGDFGEARGSGLDQAESNNRSQLLEYVKKAQAEIGEPGERNTSEYLLDYEKALAAKEAGIDLAAENNVVAGSAEAIVASSESADEVIRATNSNTTEVKGGVGLMDENVKAEYEKIFSSEADASTKVDQLETYINDSDVPLNKLAEDFIYLYENTNSTDLSLNDEIKIRNAFIDIESSGSAHDTAREVLMSKFSGESVGDPEFGDHLMTSVEGEIKDPAVAETYKSVFESGVGSDKQVEQLESFIEKSGKNPNELADDFTRYYREHYDPKLNPEEAQKIRNYFNDLKTGEGAKYDVAKKALTKMFDRFVTEKM